MSAPQPIGHNQPPLDETVRMLLENIEDLQGLIDEGLGGEIRLKRINQLVEAAGRLPDAIDNDEQSERIADFLKSIAACKKAVEDNRRRFKQPFLDMGRQIDARAKALMAPLTEADAKARHVQTAYLVAKRKAADEAARKERERLAAEAAAAAEKAKTEEDLNQAIEAEEKAQAARQVEAKPAAVRGEHGAHTGLRTTWEFELTDLASVPRQYLALDEKAVKAAIKDGVRTIPGINIFEKHGLAVR